MKTYVTNIEVNGDKAYFKEDILTLNMTGNYDNYEMFAIYEDGTTSRFGATVQEVREVLQNNRKIVLNTFEQGTEALGVGGEMPLGVSERLNSKMFLIAVLAGHDDQHGDFYRLAFPFDRMVAVWFDDEGSHNQK